MNEVSTNGTRKDYTYDDHERLTSVKETGFDGKWLKQVYAYNNDSDGLLKSTLLICNTDTLGTEKYYYENGYRTVTSFLPYNAISPNDTIIVWKLTSENDLGLPTEGRSAGNVQRTYAYDAFGRPTRRTLGSVMDFGYTYDINDNLSSRSDNLRNLSESFTYDNLDRLTGAGAGGRTRAYAPNGNVLSDTKVGSYVYGDSANPYKQTGLVPVGQMEEVWDNTVVTGPFNRPVEVYREFDDEEIEALNIFSYDGGYSLTRDYDVDMDIESCHLGQRYEVRDTAGIWHGTVLYLGGDWYSAPVAIVRHWDDLEEETPEDAAWTALNIGRDNLGSVTHLVSEAGIKISEDSYDPWGRSRNPATWTLSSGLSSGNVLGRGYGGQLYVFTIGLYHANARLYDPLTGRFLGYDPYVQDPDNTQNWNRYSYCLNNPFRYSDPDGEFFTWKISGNGIEIGFNFYDYGIPLGVGIIFSYNGGYQLGGYVEFGARVENGTFSYAATARQSFVYDWGEEQWTFTTAAAL